MASFIPFYAVMTNSEPILESLQPHNIDSPLRLDTTILQIIKLLQIKSENGMESFQGYLRNKILKHLWRRLSR